MKIVHHRANGRFDWLISEYQSVNPSREAISILLISEYQSVNPSREAISILSEKYKRFTFVHPVFISNLTPYNQAEWNLAFRKFLILSYVKKILVDNKHLKQPLSL